MAKKYKCPYCEDRYIRKDLIDHIDKKHEEMIPDGFTSSQIVFDLVNGTNGYGKCRVCGGPTNWNQSSGRYDVLCLKPSCKQKMRDDYKKNMLKVYGTYNILNDDEQQKKMLANRSISGKYRFSDGTMVTYTGSYEKKFLEFADKVMQIPSKDIIAPGPTIEYEMNGEKHFYITDFLYVPYNAIIEIKDGGDNPNTKDSNGMRSSRQRTLEKERLITNKGIYHYLRLTDNNFMQLVDFFMDIKKGLLEGIDDKVIKINESSQESYFRDNVVNENMVFNRNDIEVNVDKFESGASNILLVTGLSGSGKSTLAAQLAKKYNANNFELDCLNFYLHGIMTVDQAKEGREFGLVDFIKSKRLRVDKSISAKDEMKLYKEYIRFLINYCKKNKQNKFIIEGLQIYEVFEEGDDFITCRPIIIKGTSGLVSSIRAAKRNDGSFVKEIGPLLKWALKDSKYINSLRKAVKEASNLDLTKFGAYHLELKRDRFNKDPKLHAWDEEQYFKDMKYAVNQMKYDHITEPVEAYCYTAGNDLRPLYLGIITIYPVEDGLDWKWDEQEDISKDDYENILTNPMCESTLSNFILD